MMVPEVRVQLQSDSPVSAGGDYVLYWMIANRRPGWNFALQRAAWWSHELRKPLLILEAIGCDAPWSSDRTHRFVIQGMIDNRRAFDGRPVRYYPYIERRRGEARGLIQSFGRRACVVVSDRFPAYIYPELIRAAAAKLNCRFEAVDSCGLLPLDSTERVFERAFSFRIFLSRQLPEHVAQAPAADPLRNASIPRLAGLQPELTRQWPAATLKDLQTLADNPGTLQIDHSVPALSQPGGWSHARRKLETFLASDREQGSGLSPYLHFGHISSHEIYFAAGNRPAFLDQLITWRELGFNTCAKRKDYDTYESLPEWAKKTLLKHSADPRPRLYTEKNLEAARTHDLLWNAAQRQLVRDGIIDSYLRMLWAKKILEWSATPQQALVTMIELNNKYALDGRDPNSYNGIFWTLGRFDRPWGPERRIFGTVRYMSSENTARKMRVKEYIQRYAE